MSADFTVLKGALLIDGNGGDPIENAVLVIKNDLIEAVGTADTVEYPDDARTVDVTGKSIMPGLIDAHLHLFGFNRVTPWDMISEDPLHQGIRGVMDVWKLIDAGFTTVADACCHQAIHLRNAIDEGSIIGPRILASRQGLSQTGGHGDLHYIPLKWVKEMPYAMGRICNGVSEVRAAAREQLREGADWLKIMATGGVMSEKDSPEGVQFSLEEMQAFTEEARNWGVRTGAHAHATRGIKQALLAGVDRIEHGFYLDGECLDLMVKQNSFLVPTLVVVDFIAHKGIDAGIPEINVKKAQAHQKAHLESIKKAYQAGVTIGLGTDFIASQMFPMGNNAIELELYVKRVGMTPMETIVCATRNNATVLDLADTIGTLEPNKEADLLVVEGNPLEDITILKDKTKIVTIYKGGREVPRLPPLGVREIPAFVTPETPDA